MSRTQPPTPKRYPFSSTAVDGEFWVPLAGERSADLHDRAAARLTAAAAQYGRRHGKRFSCTIDRVFNVVRCRRIA